MCQGNGMLFEKFLGMLYNGEFLNDVKHGSGIQNGIHEEYIYDG